MGDCNASALVPLRKSSNGVLSPRLFFAHRCFATLSWSFTRFNRKAAFSLFIAYLVTTSFAVVTWQVQILLPV